MAIAPEQPIIIACIIAEQIWKLHNSLPRSKNLNSLPVKITSLSNFSNFKKKLLELLVKQAKPHTAVHLSYYTFCCVVSLSIFTSCAVLWRARRASQNTNKTSNKRFIIQHSKFLCPWGRISRIYIYEECVTEVCKAERNWRGNPANWLVNSKETCLTGPLKYKYRVIFLLVLGVIVLYEGHNDIHVTVLLCTRWP